MSQTQADPTGAASGEAAGAAPDEQPGSLLDRILAASSQGSGGARRPQVEERWRQLLSAFLVRSHERQIASVGNLPGTIEAMIKDIDVQISERLNEVMHDPKFLELEGTWRGLQHLSRNTDTGSTMKLRAMSVTKQELETDFTNQMRSTKLFTMLHQQTYNTPGGEPYGILIGDYQWSRADVPLLEKIAEVTSKSFTPFISAAAPDLLELESWSEFKANASYNGVDQHEGFSAWRSFRERDTSTFVALTMPRVMARLPYGDTGRKVDEFHYEELPRQQAEDGSGTKLGELAHDHYCWMNAAYALGGRMARAFDDYGFCTRIRGRDSGGRVDQLPTHTYTTRHGNRTTKCPTEVAIPDNLSAELGRLGLMPISYYQNSDYAVFFEGQTVHKPAKYDSVEATANAAISARLPYVMASCRFAHYLKVLGRDMVGSFKEAADVQFTLDNWIKQYSQMNPEASETLKARYPLREARVQVVEIPENPGAYTAIAYLRPWLQFEELNASIRMVADIPKKST